VLQSNLAEFQAWQIFMQIKQRIFKSFTMQICCLFFTAFWNFWIITRLSTGNHRWVSLKQVRFFGSPCKLLVRVNSCRVSKIIWTKSYQLRYLSPGSGESCFSFSETAHLGVQENPRAASGNCCGHSVKWLRSRSKNHNISVTSEIMLKHRKQH